MKDAPGSSHKSCYLQCRPVAVSRSRGNPRHTGPRRLIASPPAAGATQSGLRRPGPLKITASCGRNACHACHAHCLLAPCAPGQAQCSCQSLPHPSRQFIRHSPALRDVGGPLTPLIKKQTQARAGKAAQGTATRDLADGHNSGRRHQCRPRQVAVRSWPTR